jgi:hypothetical protein
MADTFPLIPLFGFLLTNYIELYRRKLVKSAQCTI